MKLLPIQVEEGGRLKLVWPAVLPTHARLAVLVLEDTAEKTEALTAASLARLAEVGGSFDFLKEEPDLYTDADIEPGQHNPDFAGHAPTR